MNQALNPLPSPKSPSHDLSVRLLKLESLLQTVRHSHEELHSRVRSIVTAVADLNRRTGKDKEKSLEKDVIEIVLTGPGKTFLWKLTPLKPIPTFVPKRKMISFGFDLEALEEAQLSPDEDISLVIHVLNCAKTRVIESTMSGKPILSGGTGKAVYNSTRNRFTFRFYFTINEVSSHFELGRVAVLFQVECPTHVELQQLIQPFVIEDLVVRAKEITCRKDRSQRKREAI